MSIGEVLVIVRSMNGGDASGDVQALGTAISETWRIGNVLMADFEDTGAQGLGASACRDAGYRLGSTVSAWTERVSVGHDSMSTASGIIVATSRREAEIEKLREYAGTVPGRVQSVLIRSYLEDLMNSTYTHPITGVQVAATDDLRDADDRVATLLSFTTAADAVNSTTGSNDLSGMIPTTANRPVGASPVTQTVSTNNGTAPVSTRQETNAVRQPGTSTAADSTKTSTQSSNSIGDMSNAATRQEDTDRSTQDTVDSNRDDPTVTATRDTTVPTMSVPNGSGPNTSGPTPTGPGNRNLNLSTPLSLPGLNTPTGTPGSPGSVPRSGSVPITSGGPRSVLSPRGVAPLGTTSGTSTTSAVPGTSAARPMGGGAVPPGTRTSGSRDGGGGHTVASYLRTRGNGEELVGSLPLVAPPVIGDWDPVESEDAEREGDSGSGEDSRR
ncbi:MAG: hypothetical protein WAV90_23965 [Gordonia amarae]